MPMNLRSCGGSKLFPRLFVALYYYYNTFCSSGTVINCYLGSSKG
jgi:hypothetical protein